VSRRVLVVVTSLAGAGEIRSTVASRFDDEGADVRVVAPTVAETTEHSDPLTAIQDALREFPADEIVVVTRPEEDTTWLERGTGDSARFDIPVTHLVLS
jgi:siroheme synthase (precorrin-2 oxidase/ferrochelatase)